MDRGTWLPRVHGVTELDTTEQLNTHTHTHTTHQAPCWTPTHDQNIAPVHKELHDQERQTQEAAVSAFHRFALKLNALRRPGTRYGLKHGHSLSLTRVEEMHATGEVPGGQWEALGAGGNTSQLK